MLVAAQTNAFAAMFRVILVLGAQKFLRICCTPSVE